MKQLIFQDKTTIERLNLLEGNADDVIEGYYYERVLTEEQVIEEQEAFARTHIELQNLEEEKRQIVEGLNEQIKIKKKLAEKSLQMIKTGREEVKETVYVINDEDEGKIGTYNHRGELIAERPMRGAERQRKMRFSNEQVTVSVLTDEGKYKAI